MPQDPLNYSLGLVDITALKEHEEIDEQHLSQLTEKIRSDGFLKDPIIVDKNTNIILDGHHRFNSLRRIGCKRIYACFVDYKSPRIRVCSRRKERVTKELVINAGLSGNKLKTKTSKHLIPHRPKNILIKLENLR
ncbi:MAG: ParB N-terminal domain-containing protein [Candidatus Aenigmarchaeota archaeon]|nr:ParB N-terminal domain-containing protein [Candidatus Aenigmarchaeota archaeon]